VFQENVRRKNMKRLLVLSAILVLSLALATSALGQGDMARARVVHASPDAPAVDVWVNGSVAFSNAPFKGITDYAELAPGSYQVQVTPTGATEPVVIDATLDLTGGTDYTVVAVGELANIEPLVLVDNNSAPAAGKAHVRFVHASPDAPAVDIAVADGGPVLFANVSFKGTGDYLPVDAGTYDLEARLAGTDTVALSVPGVALADGTVYTIFAMGLAGGEPALTAVPSVDASYPVATTLPETGGETSLLWLVVTLGAGLALIGGGLILRSRKDEIAA
jgi:LPXTG-motif cell wall-anchored protein